MQRPWNWVDGDEEGEGWKGWTWRLYFVVIDAALFVVLFFSYIICKQLHETLLYISSPCRLFSARFLSYDHFILHL